MRNWLPIVFVVTGILSGCNPRPHSAPLNAEERAIAFLERNVPAWSRENNCFSCHNNGDAARALYKASRHGYQISKTALADTTGWVTHPDRWEHNKGDPGFSDKRLADLQFALALSESVDSSSGKSSTPLKAAAAKVVQGQAEDGSWPIDAANAVGSPATWGTTLATYQAWDFLGGIPSPENAAARLKATQKLQKLKADTVPNAAVMLRYARKQRTAMPGEALEFLRSTQTSDGGWGPYADSPPEVFDTSLALLSLAELKAERGVPEMLRRGRAFLIQTQLANGSWPPTTRPSGGESYAQQVSTTGWATLALLATR